MVTATRNASIADDIPIRYQYLAIEARDIWQEWTNKVLESSQSELPAGLSPDDRLLQICGSYFLCEEAELQGYYKDSLATMEKTAPEFRKTQFLKTGKVRLSEAAS